MNAGVIDVSTLVPFLPLHGEVEAIIGGVVGALTSSIGSKVRSSSGLGIEWGTKEMYYGRNNNYQFVEMIIAISWYSNIVRRELIL